MVKVNRGAFAGQLGTVGGTMGLFTGRNLMSFVEMGYWVNRTAVNVNRR